jgi:DNA-binding transcriptional regulator YiaG
VADEGRVRVNCIAFFLPSPPWGRVALLGIEQSQIRVFCAHIPAIHNERKSLPTSIQTLGDSIQMRRYEKRITLPQLAEKMGIAQTTIRAWELDTIKPDPQQLELLGRILGHSIRVDLPNFR